MVIGEGAGAVSGEVREHMLYLVREQEERLREVTEDSLEKARSPSLTWSTL